MMGDVVQSSMGRISYDAEEASIVAAFSEDCVRRGFIRKVEKFRKRIVYRYFMPSLSFRCTPYFLFNSWSSLAQWHSSTKAPKFKTYFWGRKVMELHSGSSLWALQLQASSSSWPWLAPGLSAWLSPSTSSCWLSSPWHSPCCWGWS